MLARVAIASLLVVTAAAGSAAPLNYNGTLTAVELDTGGIFSGTPLGTAFSVRIGSLNPDGSLPSGTVSGGGSSVSFSCPGPTIATPGGEECSALGAGPGFTDDATLDTATAALLNDVFGGSTFSAGQQLDMVNIEGDAATSAGRIEVGFTFLLDPGTHSGSDFGSMSPAFDPSLASHTLFFIAEQDGSGDVYSALGDATPVKVPLPPWTGLGAALGIGLVGWTTALRSRAAIRSSP